MSRPVSKNYPWLVVGMLWFICLFNYADRQAISAVFPALKQEFGFTDTDDALVAIERGLKWLLATQNADGSWTGGDGSVAIGGTSLGLMAFMVKGHFPGFGKHGPALDRAKNFLLKAAEDSPAGVMGSMYEHGSRDPVSISLRNTYGGITTSSASIDRLTDQLAAQLRMFSQPLRMLRRTIALPYYEGMAPGDVVSITDSFARDPATGARGLTAKAGLVVSVEVDWGGSEVDSGSIRQALGQVDVLVFPRDRIFAYAPAAEFVGSAYTSGSPVRSAAMVSAMAATSARPVALR